MAADEIQVTFRAHLGVTAGVSSFWATARISGLLLVSMIAIHCSRRALR
jgi:hypothetical protein